MPTRARRLVVHMVRATMRRAAQTMCLSLGMLAPAAWAETVISARFAAPTLRYAHAVLGDAEEWGALEIHTTNRDSQTLSADAVVRNRTITITLPQNAVFEDVAPRLADVDGDGNPEVIVVETHVDLGASLAIYTVRGKLAATPYIGQRNRWLAPIGIADLDGDGAVELAYIDRPHLAKTLRVWRFADGGMTQIAALEGLTNHRIGERDIAGGLRDCGQGTEMIVATGDWRSLVAVTLENETLHSHRLGPHKNRDSFAAALACK